MRFSLEDALSIAEVAHEDQTRDGGAPYIDHVRRVVDACEPHGLDAQIVAALHDVVEDSDMTLDELQEFYGVPWHIIAAVDAISRRECEECRGNGKVLSDKRWTHVWHRVRAVTHPWMTDGMVTQITDTALDGVLEDTCTACGGGNDRLEKREDYLARVRANPLATVVKIEDARDNRDDDARPGMYERYKWVLEQLGVAE